MHDRRDCTLQCCVGVEQRTTIYFPPSEVDYYKRDGSKIKMTPDEEGRLFKNGQWGQVFYVNMPDDLIQLLDNRLEEFMEKSQFHEKDNAVAFATLRYYKYGPLMS